MSKPRKSNDPPAAVLPPPERLWTRRRAAGILTGAALLLVLVLGGVLLQQNGVEREQTAAQKRLFAAEVVTDLLADDAQAESWSEGLRLGTQEIEVELVSGPYKGAVLETVNYLSAYSNVDCQVGTRIIVRLDYDDNGQPYIVSVPNYDRGIVLVGMLVVSRIDYHILHRFALASGGKLRSLTLSKESAHTIKRFAAGALCCLFAALVIFLVSSLAH